MKIETDVITIIAPSPIGGAVILVIKYVETLTSALFMEVPVPNQKSERSCDLEVSISPYYWIFFNCSNGEVFCLFVFHFI